jgi:peptide/nickel transport system permease protein
VRRIDPWLAVALTLLFVLLFVALFGSWLAPREAIDLVLNLDRQPPPYAPSTRFPLGSDAVGRDLLSLILAGARATLGIAVIAGLARVAVGVALAMLASTSRIARESIDALADLLSAVPATLVAVLAVLAFSSDEAAAITFVGALLVTGWAGPYRILSSELARLASAPFTESALAVGMTRSALLARHHLPHVLPIALVSASQQAAASLVALAELGVLAVFVGRTYLINLVIAAPPEWGGLLARGRTVESLYTTRWMFLVPGTAIAIAAIAFGLLGVGIARQYRRRNVLDGIRSRGGVVTALAVAGLFAVSAVLPERYAAARAWSADARAGIDAHAEVESALRDEGFVPIGPDYAVPNTLAALRQNGPAVVSLSGPSGRIDLRSDDDASSDLQPFLFSGSGGGVVDAPVVFAGWGIAPEDFATQSTNPFAFGIGRIVSTWADDYASIDAAGKVVVILRLPGVRVGSGGVLGPDVATIVGIAADHGAKAVLYVDPLKGKYAQVVRAGGSQIDPYRRLVDTDPPERAEGMPVFVTSVDAADRILAQSGVRPSDIYAAMGARLLFVADESKHVSMARSLSLDAHIELPVGPVSIASRSLVGERPTSSGGPRLVIWCVMPSASDDGAADVAADLARLISRRAVDGAIVVFFDPRGDQRANANLVRDRLGDRRVGLLLVVEGLRGDHLEVLSASPDLVPASDRSAQVAGRVIAQRSAASDVQWAWFGVNAFADARALWLRGAGPAGRDLRPDAAAYLGYVVGRWAIGAAELLR